MGRDASPRRPRPVQGRNQGVAVNSGLGGFAALPGARPLARLNAGRTSRRDVPTSVLGPRRDFAATIGAKTAAFFQASSVSFVCLR